MLRNYLKTFFRQLIREPFYSFSILLGLAVSVSAVLLISLFVYNEMSYDRFIPDHQSVYRVVENQYYKKGEPFPVAVTPVPLGPELKENYQQVERQSRFLNWGDQLSLTGQEDVFQGDGALVDPDFIKIFAPKWLEGDPRAAFRDPGNLVLTLSYARRFGEPAALIGKTLKNENGDLFTISGIIADPPAQSHLQYDFLGTMQYFTAKYTRYNWGSNILYTYVKLTPGHSGSDLNPLIKGEIKKNNQNSVSDIYLQPVTDIHLGKVNFVAEVSGKGNILYVRIFSLAAFLALLIACFNFINLSLARSTQRIKEIAVRKTLGSGKRTITLQHLMESALMAFFAISLALLLADLLLPYFNQLTATQLELHFQMGPVWLILSGVWLICGVGAGIYPALMISRFRPSALLGEGIRRSRNRLKKGLVVLQFAITLFLITGSLVVNNQLQYLLNYDIGMRRNQVIWMRANQAVRQKWASLQPALKQVPGVEHVTLSSQNPSTVESSTSGLRWPGADPDKPVLFHYLLVDPHFLTTMNIKLLEGRNFSGLQDTVAAIINQKAAEVMGLEHPVGQVLQGFGQDITIIGVVKDFNFKSLYHPVEPLILGMNVEQANYVLAQFDPGHTREVIAGLENIWTEFNPGEAFSYHFLSDDYARLYRGEQRTSLIFSSFSLLAILISSIGLLGVVLYHLRQQMRDFSIRKVFGASVWQLSGKVLGRVGVWVMWASLLATPLTWWLMRNWLSDFSYRIQLSVWYFLGATLAVLVIALLTVVYHTLKIARINPAKTLRSE